MMLLRSMVFVPGNNMRMITKAATLAADAIILDLEDAVPLASKATARIMIRDSIKGIKAGGANVFVRLNALTTNLTTESLKFVCIEGLDGVILPKTETESDMLELDGMMVEAEKASGLEPRSVKVIPQIESAKGVLNSYEIASTGERIIALAFGSGDYYRDLGRSVDSLSPEQTELSFARSHIINSSVAAGVQPIDTIFFGLLTDRESFVKETMMALQLGFKGKLLVHPTQIEPANKIFSPAPSEVEYARRMVKVFEEAQSRGLGAISFEGKMIDIMNYTQAKDLLDLVEIIAKKEERRQRASSVSLSQFFLATPRRA